MDDIFKFSIFNFLKVLASTHFSRISETRIYPLSVFIKSASMLAYTIPPSSFYWLKRSKSSLVYSIFMYFSKFSLTYFFIMVKKSTLSKALWA